jgi:hypothetical protein
LKRGLHAVSIARGGGQFKSTSTRTWSESPIPPRIQPSK